MKLSTRSRYGLKAIVDIAAHFPNPITIKEIAERQSIPQNYLEQIVAILKKSHFVKSIRGAQGGYILNCNPSSTSVGAVLKCLEGSLYPVDCLSNNSCKDADCNNCFTKSVWLRIYQNLNDTVESITISDLINDYKKLSYEKGEVL